MTFAYTLGTRRRLVLGPPHAPARLCVPIPPEVYDAVAALPERDQGLLVQMLGEFLGHVVAAWPEPTPVSQAEVVTAWPAPQEGSAPAAEREASREWDRGLHL